MPPVSKQQKTSKAGWTTRKRQSPSTSAQKLSPAKAALAAKRIADVRREASSSVVQNNHNVQQDPRANGSSTLALHPIHAEYAALAQRSQASSSMMVDPSVKYTAVPRPIVAKPAAHQHSRSAVQQSRPAQQTVPVSQWCFPAPKFQEDSPYRELDYQVEIVHYMVDMDNCSLATVDSMDSQPEVQWFMRPFLLDFLIEVHAQFRLRPETLYLALNLVDRYVSKRVVYKKHYQLVGCAALWTAAKFEDQKDRVPLVKELSEMCCKAYDESAFIQMEGHVLGTVNWNLGAPSAEAWLRLFNKEANEDKRTQDIARFVMEMTLYYRDFVGMPAYDIATAAMILARFIDGKHRRTDLLQGRRNLFGIHSPIRVMRMVKMLDVLFGDWKKNVSDVLFRKYQVPAYSQASVLVHGWYKAGNFFVPPPPEMIYYGGPIAIGSESQRWSNMSSSPSGGQSSSSSENGDEPLTPNTPLHMHNIDPFSAAAKENVAPTPTKVKAGVVPTSIGVPPPHPNQKISTQVNTQFTAPGKFYEMQAQQLAARPALVPLPPTGDLSVPRAGHPFDRRLSN